MHTANDFAAAAELDAFYAVGSLLYDNQEYRRAADVFRLVALLDPTRGDTWWALGACHEREGELAVAAVVYETGFHLGGQSVDAGLLCARAFHNAGESARALEMIELLKRERLDSVQAARVEGLEAELRRAGSCR